MATTLYLVLLLVAAGALAINRVPLWGWAAAALVGGLAGYVITAGGLWILPAMTLIGGLTLAALSVGSVRRRLLTGPAFDVIRSVLPAVSDTEQQALDAGTIGFDRELFSGRPDFAKLAAVPPITLSDEERAFLDGPTEELCRMIDDWQIRHEEKEIPEALWSFVKREGFLGMLISKAHGGLGFSAQAQSLILGKIASRSPDAVTIVMVPNSLGPGELLEKYGTPGQQAYYLPRLARGEEVPCFSLTGPTSGSDAATMRDIGVVERGLHEGRETLGIRLSWDKRYITLGPKATLVGLAFHLTDPENLLGKGERPGITLAIIPANHPGVNIGRRHLPSGAAFPNGPNWGTRCLHSHRLGDRRRRTRRTGLAHVDGMSISRPRHLAAFLGCGRRQIHAPLFDRIRPRAQAIRPAGGQDGGPRRASRASGRKRLRHRGGPRGNRRHG